MYRLLWVSSSALHDHCASARYYHGLMTALARLYADCVEIQALCPALYAHSAAAAAQRSCAPDCAGVGAGPACSSRPRVFEEQGIVYTYLPCSSAEAPDLGMAEMIALQESWAAQLRTFRPDVCIVGGGDVLGRALIYEAQGHGVPAVHCHDGTLRARALCGNADLLWTAARATAAYAAEHWGLNLLALGPYGIPPAAEPGPAERGTDLRECQVTVYAPQPRQALALALALALAARAELPGVRFRAVAGQAGGWLDAPEGGDCQRHLDSALAENLELCPAELSDAALCTHTRLLLLAEPGYEPWGREAATALLHGIAVLGAGWGALPEVTGMARGAGLCLEGSSGWDCDHLQLPAPAQIRPWLEGVRTLLAEGHASHVQAGRQAAAELTAEAAARRAWEALQVLLLRRAGTRAWFLRPPC